MSESGGHYAKRNKTIKEDNAWFQFYVKSKKIKLIKAESRMVAPKGWGGELCGGGRLGIDLGHKISVGHGNVFALFSVQHRNYN